MKRNIWILNHYASSMYVDKGGRHYAIPKYLKKIGYSPTVFCCNVLHNADKVVCEDMGLYKRIQDEKIEVPFVFVRARKYEGNGKQRVANMLDFFVNVLRAAFKYAKINGNPDVIYASSVHPLTLIAGIILAKRYGVKCICEIRDLWPESIVEYSSKLTKDNPIIKLLYLGEKWIYTKADALVFTVEGGKDYIIERRWDKGSGGPIDLTKVYSVNNGVDLEEFNYWKETYVYSDIDIDKEADFKVIYTGSIRRVNNLRFLLEVAQNVKNPNVKFLIWGSGDEEQMLRQYVLDNSLDNVIFKGRVEKKYIPSIVSRADLNFAHNSSSNLFRFGISFNKIFDYMAAGKPILVDFVCKYNPVIDIGAGIEINQEAIVVAEKIEEIANMDSKSYNELCFNALKGAEKYNYSNLTNEIIKIIEK